jgi:hypothetical protein
MTEPVSIVCLRAQQMAVPPVPSVLRACSNCQRNVWLSLEGQTHQARTGALLVCDACLPVGTLCRGLVPGSAASVLKALGAFRGN